jgi:hypothetical protein
VDLLKVGDDYIPMGAVARVSFRMVDYHHEYAGHGRRWVGRVSLHGGQAHAVTRPADVEALREWCRRNTTCAVDPKGAKKAA